MIWIFVGNDKEKAAHDAMKVRVQAWLDSCPRGRNDEIILAQESFNKEAFDIVCRHHNDQGTMMTRELGSIRCIDRNRGGIFNIEKAVMNFTEKQMATLEQDAAIRNPQASCPTTEATREQAVQPAAGAGQA